MKHSIEAKIILGLAALLLLALALSYFTGFFAVKPGMASMQLVSFDKKVDENSNACYSLLVKPVNLGKKIMSFQETAGNKVTFKTDLTLEGNEQAINNCIKPENLESGINLIDLRLDADRLFFHVEKSQNVEKLTPSLEITSINDNAISINVSNNDGLSFEPLTIFVNNVKDHSVYFSGRNVQLTEKINLQAGNNDIKVSFKGAEAKTSYALQEKFSMNVFAGLALIVLLFAVFMLFVFSGKELIEKIAFSLAGLFISIMALMYALLLLNILSVESLALSVIAAIILLAFIYRKNFKFSHEKIDLPNLSPLFLLLLAFIIGSALFFTLFSGHYVSAWTNYYERQAELIVSEQKLLLEDPLSFLGLKPAGYLSGYFFADAGIGLLSGLQNPQYFALIQLLAKLFLLFSGLALFKALDFSNEKASLALMLFFLTGFIFGDVLFSARHLIALGFGFLSIALMIKGRPLAAGLLLAFSTFVQAPMIALALPASLALVPSGKYRQLIKSFGVAALISLILFAWVFLSFGLPVQAKSTVWGHLGTLPLYGAVVDLFALIAFAVLFLSPYALKKEIPFDAFSRKLATAVIILLFIQLFISYRVNVITAFLLASLLAFLFPGKVLESKAGNCLISAAFILGLGVAFSIAVGFAVPSSITDASSFIKANTSTGSNFLVEPVLGHSIAFFGKRKILSDLAVEYSFPEMIDDSYAFLKESNPAILDKYGIDFVVNRRDLITEAPVGFDFYPKILEFDFLDKVYSNGFVFVHAVPK
ncbi:hypothetical protein HZB89_02355 [archaeon]|nr:hypothetical protein [archaeon]